jgi:NADPH:quinone reductase-like Zn-dependent oxidoreductase
MRALVLDQPGDFRKLHLGEVATPQPGEGEIRVAVYAVGLNPVDYKLAGWGHPAWTYPHILGLDVGGVVDAVGPGVKKFKTGDRVMYHGDLSKSGGLAEYAVVGAHIAARVPRTISLATAASLPCAGMTAYHALHRRLHVRRGQSILIQAAAGGVGGFAVQLAKHAGLTVVATCSGENVAYVRDLGADVVVDYRKDNLKAAVSRATRGRGVNAILESLGPDQAKSDMELLAFNGAMACLLGLPDLSGLQPFTVSPSLHEVALGAVHQYGSRRQVEDLAVMGYELLDLLKRGDIHPLPMETLSLGQAVKGLEMLAKGHVRGKVVVQVRN